LKSLIPTYFRSGRLRAFTLIEVIIAIGLVATVMVTLVTLAGYIYGISREIRAKQEALRLMGAVESYVASADFDTVYGWAAAGEDLVAYRYWGDPVATPRLDGTPVPYAGAPDGQLVVSARPDDDPLLADDLAQIDGYLFRFQLSLSEENPEPDPSQLPATAAAYGEPVIVFDVAAATLPDVSAVSQSLKELFVFPIAKRR